VERARAAGCDAVLVWGACDLPAEVARLTSARRPMSSMTASAKPPSRPRFDSLRPRGMLVSFAHRAERPTPFAVGTLNAKARCSFTRPGSRRMQPMLRNIASAPMRFSAPWPPASLSRRPGTPFRSPRRRQPCCAGRRQVSRRHPAEAVTVRRCAPRARPRGGLCSRAKDWLSWYQPQQSAVKICSSTFH